MVASQVEDEVMEYTRKIVRNPQFIKDLQEKVMTAVDMTEVENDITAYKNQLSALQRSRAMVCGAWKAWGRDGRRDWGGAAGQARAPEKNGVKRARRGIPRRAPRD